MPLVIPESSFMKEADHVKGFAPETAIITIGGKEELAERLIVRPTSEVLFCEHYAKIVSSYRDLPKKYNQWCNVVRWEKTTRPFLRGSEFLWQEGHTIHSTEQEAKEEVLGMLDIYNQLGSDLLAVPFVMGKKTEKEKFAGAEETYAIEALMPDGKALQSGTTHYFGTGFASHFNINFQDKDGVVKTPFQTSWGVSTRLIGAIIMVHGDDSGLVLPPYVAPTQVVIIPIQQNKPGVMEQSLALKAALEAQDVRVKLDDSDKTAGWKFSEYEMKGVPLRVEIGPRDLENGECVVVRRVDNEKTKIKIVDLPAQIPSILTSIHQLMYAKALANVQMNTRPATSYEEFKDLIVNHPGYIKMMWCGRTECEEQIKAETSATSRCIPFVQEHLGDTCPVCGRKAEMEVFFAKAY
jgi:prolyl-tRNA synthetase